MSDINDFTKHQHIIEDNNSIKKVISIDLITKLSKTARIKLSDEEKSQYLKELTSVITWVDKLRDIECDDNDVESADYQVIDRKVVDHDSNQQDDVLGNTDTEYKCFIVPKIVEND